jgi:hypothetical protein
MNKHDEHRAHYPSIFAYLLFISISLSVILQQITEQHLELEQKSIFSSAESIKSKKFVVGFEMNF